MKVRGFEMKYYKITNLDCANCANKLEHELQNLQGVKEVRISFATNILQIDCADIQSVKDKIAKLEPKVQIFECQDESNKNNYENMENATNTTPENNSRFWYLNAEFWLLVGLIVVFVLSLCASHYYIPKLPNNTEIWIMICKALWIVIYLIAGREVFKGAYRSFRKKEFFDENLLMLVASIAAFGIDAWEEAVSIMLFFSAGEYLQNLSLNRSKESINALSNFAPPKAHKITESKTATLSDVAPNELQTNDEIIVYAGEMVPTDSVLLDEEASLDCSALNGESLPMQAYQNQEVLAGSIALGKVIKLKVSRPFEKSQIAKITELIQNATTQKSQTENFITTFARYYTPIVLLIAVIIAILPPLALGQDWNTWIYRALVVLMVSCPCALVISVPIGYFGGLAASSKRGVLIKGSNFLEALSQLSLIGFDKTGTLTKGVFKVVEVIPQAPYTNADVLGYALCAQNLSTHPIAQSIKNEYQKLAHSHHISEFEELSGLGVRAVCDNHEILAGNDKILHKFNIAHNTCDVQGSVIHISVDKNYIGYILIADELKDEALEVIDKLKKMHIQPVILSGDGQYPCQVVANKLDCEYYHSLLPQDKAQKFFELKERAGKKVGFVGDGINDAPTLALADVGISMGSGSDISRQNADVIVLNNSLHSLLKSIQIAKKTKIIIYENIIFALGIKGAFIVLGLFGVATIWEAVFGDVGVALLALANAMRTLKVR